MERLVHRAYEIAKKELGIKEVPGSGDNPRIIEYLKSCHVNEENTVHDEIPWCSAFVTWCLQQAGGKGTKSLSARSYLSWGVETKSPKEGDIVVFKRGGSKSKGHVGFFVSKDNESVQLLSGNSSNQVRISRYKLDDALGYRTSKG